jgi:hypothetical protein
MNDLVSGELRQLYLNSSGKLEVDEAHRRELISHIKTILTQMHTRLLIKVGVLDIRILAEKQRYTILPENADSSTAPFVKFIMDTEVPYTGDLLKIFRILIPYEDTYIDAKDNIWNDSDSFRINQFNEVIVPASYTEDHFKIEYHANFVDFSIEDGITAPENIWINLPPGLETVLRLGVAGRKMGTVGMTGSAVEGINYSAQYNAELDRIVFENSALSSLTYADETFIERGWV